MQQAVPFLLHCQRPTGAYVEGGESIVERMRTISARWVGDICCVMWTMESMATSGLAWTKLGREETEREDESGLYTFSERL